AGCGLARRPRRCIAPSAAGAGPPSAGRAATAAPPADRATAPPYFDLPAARPALLPPARPLAAPHRRPAAHGRAQGQLFAASGHAGRAPPASRLRAGSCAIVGPPLGLLPAPSISLCCRRGGRSCREEM